MQQSNIVAAGDLFWHSVVDPVSFRDRVFDRRILGGFEVRRHICMSYSIPEDVLSHFVTVLRPRRGRIISGVEVRSGTGRELPLLSMSATARLVLVTLQDKLNELTLAGEETTADCSAESLLMLQQGVDTPALTRESVDRFEEEVAVLAAGRLSHSGASGPLADQIAKYVGVVAARELMVCRMPADEGGLVVLSMREVLGSVLHDSPAAADRIAIALDAVPSRCVVPLYKGSKSNDYQLDLDVGPGNFVVAIEPSAEVDGLTTSGLGTQVASVRAHSLSHGRHELHVDIAEHPNNTMLFAVGLAFVTVLVAGALLMVPRVTGRSATVLDVSALVAPLAVIFGAVWSAVGRSVRGRALPLGSLASIGASVVVLVLAGMGRVLLDGEARFGGLLGVAAAAFAAWAVVSWKFVRALLRLSALRSETAVHHPETPLSR